METIVVSLFVGLFLGVFVCFGLAMNLHMYGEKMEMEKIKKERMKSHMTYEEQLEDEFKEPEEE